MNAARKPYDLVTADHDYPPWDGPPARSILICTQPRSGSTLLGEALYFAGGLGCPLEYLHPGFRPRFEAEWNVRETDAYIRETWRRRTEPNGTLAIKLMWHEVHALAVERGLAEFETAPPEAVPPEAYRRLAELIADALPQPVWIYLYRRDRLRQAVSALVADQTGQWRAIVGSEMPRQCEPEYDAAAIGRMIAFVDHCNRHWCNLLAALEVPHISLAYEDLVREYGGSVSNLLAALGSPGSPPPIRMRRQADGVSEAFVLRYLEERGSSQAT